MKKILSYAIIAIISLVAIISALMIIGEPTDAYIAKLQYYFGVMAGLWLIVEKIFYVGVIWISVSLINQILKPAQK